MKRISVFPIFLIMLSVLYPACDIFAVTPVDMRAQQQLASEQLAQLQAKADAEREAAEREAAASRARLTNDRTSLENELQRLEKSVQELDKTVTALMETEQKLAAEEMELLNMLGKADGEVKELVGITRIHAKDLSGLLVGNLQSALSHEETGFLRDIADAQRFPGMEDIGNMNTIVYDQLRRDGAVRLTRGEIIDRSGNSVVAEILVLGSFTAAYRLSGEVGFLSYSPAGRKLFALSRLPTREQRHRLLAYMDGKEDGVPIDISRGGALSQMMSTPTLAEQVRSGGPLVWPILAILGAGLLIMLERVLFLFRSRVNAEVFMAAVVAAAEQGNWSSWVDTCAGGAKKPLGRIIRAGLDCVDKGRETMENALQEAILREIPPMERFLSTLGMLAAIAPLLGLLGTVTGMINTFHVITQYGTGDPRMMSGGISVALVTTMLGLSVAIPIMLIHTLLNRAVDNRIATLEEKAVALVNIVEKYHGMA